MEPKTANNHPANLLTKIAGLISAVLGLTVMAGWYTGSITLIKIVPSFSAMQFNTALSFLLCGIGLLSLAFSKPRLALICGIAVSLIGLLTLIQYIFGINLGIDQLLMRDYMASSLSSHPGRMAPPTALNFALTGTSLLIISGFLRPRQRSLVLGLLGAIILPVAIVSLLGYLTRIEAAYMWGRFKGLGMAVHTATGFLFIGAAIISFAWKEEKAEGVTQPKWFPLIVMIGALTATFIMWRVALVQESAHIVTKAKLATLSIKHDIDDQMASRILALVRMSKRWEVFKPLKNEWEYDANLYVSHFPGYKTIEWLSPSLKERWTVSSSGDTVKEQELGSDERHWITSDAARNRQEIMAFGYPGGFKVYVPISHGNSFGGFIVGVFDHKELFSNILSDEIARLYSVSLLDGNKEVYSHNYAGMGERDLGYEAELDLYSIKWRMLVWPGPDVLKEVSSSLPLVALAAGLLLSFLLTLAIYLAQKAQLRTKEVQLSKLELEREVAERKIANEGLQLLHNLSLAIKDAPDFRSVLQTAISEVCKAAGWSFGEAWIPRSDGSALELGAAWHDERKDFEKFIEHCKELTFQPGVGLPGRIWISRRPEWIKDLSVGGEVFPRAKAAAEAGLKAGFGTPIIADGRVLAVIEFFLSETHEEDSRYIDLASTASNQLGSVIQHKLAEEKLKESEERLREAQQISRLGNWNWDIVNNELTWSDEIYRIFGLAPQEFGATYEAFMNSVHPDDRDLVNKSVNEALSENKPYSIDHRVVLPNGTERIVHEQAAVTFDETGKPVRMAGIVQDITERKMTEDLIKRQAQELARSNAELQKFAYVASHDLQEPLRTISSFTQLLARRYKDKLDSDADEFISFIVDGAKRMQRLINDLLAYSRVGTMGKAFETADFEALLGNVLANLNEAISEGNAIVSHDPLPTIIADPTQMEQLFQNLISNAIKFRGEEPPKVHISAEKMESEWLFSVRDNGIGIAPDYFDRIFIIFQRLHGKDDYSGTGIGLAVCKKIVERHGGRIWVESEKGKGSTFYFTIPVKNDR